MLVQATQLAKQAAITALSLCILATLLFGGFTFIMPMGRWIVWRESMLLAAGGAVVLLLAWPFRRPTRDLMLDGLAAALGLASAITAIAVSILVPYGVTLQVAEHQGSIESLVYRLTEPVFLWQLLCFAIVPAMSGTAGLWISRWGRRDATRVSLAASAARFSTLGLLLSGILGVFVMVAALCRRILWP